MCCITNSQLHCQTFECITSNSHTADILWLIICILYIYVSVGIVSTLVLRLKEVYRSKVLGLEEGENYISTQCGAYLAPNLSKGQGLCTSAHTPDHVVV